jgi:hypothetical protein
MTIDYLPNIKPIKPPTAAPPMAALRKRLLLTRPAPPLLNSVLAKTEVAAPATP